MPNPSATGQAGLPEQSVPCTHPSVFLWTPHPQGGGAGLVCAGATPISTCAESGPLRALCIILMWLQTRRGCLSAQLSGDFFSPLRISIPLDFRTERQASLTQPLGILKGSQRNICCHSGLWGKCQWLPGFSSVSPGQASDSEGRGSPIC